MRDEVTTDSGSIRGAVSDDRRVRVFKGIPFAAPPVGALRWRAPQAPAGWAGVRDARTFGPQAPQIPLPPTSLLYAGSEPMSEDCLYLNVWTGGAGEPAERPVLVWIPYGAFQYGSGANPLFDGERLARAGCTVVTFNYRLGRLGFLATPELTDESGHGASGNYGLMDQVAALQWVGQNIGAFGGDPGNVTVFGVSAGGHSVNCLRASPLAAGLFHRAITQSGTGFSRAIDGPGHAATMQALPAAEAAGAELCDQLGTHSLDELRRLSPDQIAAPQLPRARGPWTFSVLPPGVTIGSAVFDTAYPIIDGYVLPEPPRDVFAAGRQHDVPFLAGNVCDESTGPYVPSLSAYEADVRSEYGELATEVLALYPADGDQQARRASADLFADRTFTWSTWMAARLHRRTGSAPGRYYRFMRRPPVPADGGFVEGPDAGAYHTSEVAYVFGNLHRWDWPWQPADHALSEMLLGYWVNFAATGNPNGAGLPPWPECDAEVTRAMCFGDDGTAAIVPVPNRERLALWTRYYDAHRGVGVIASR